MPTAVYTIKGWAGELVQFDGRLAVATCPSCHMVYAIPEEMRRRALLYNSGDYPKNYVSVCCPNGHSWHYTGEDSALVKARREAEAVRDALTWTQDRLHDAKVARDHAEAQARGYKGALVKTKKRLAAGVCPYCNRTFTDSRMAWHIYDNHRDAVAMRGMTHVGD